MAEIESFARYYVIKEFCEKISQVNYIKLAAAAKSFQSCLTLYNPIDSVLPHPWDSPGKNTGVGCHLLLQCMKVKSQSEVSQLLSVRLFTTPWTAAHQAPPSMGYSRQESWSGVPLYFEIYKMKFNEATPWNNSL